MKHELCDLKNQIQEKSAYSVKLQREVYILVYIYVYIYILLDLVSLNPCSYIDNKNQESGRVQVMSLCYGWCTKSWLVPKNMCLLR